MTIAELIEKHRTIPVHGEMNHDIGPDLKQFAIELLEKIRSDSGNTDDQTGDYIDKALEELRK